MHTHDDQKGHGLKMMWMMLICCLASVLLLTGGLEIFKSIGYSWIGIGLVGVALAYYVIRIRHRHNGDNAAGLNTENQEKSENHSNCCH